MTAVLDRRAEAMTWTILCDEVAEVPRDTLERSVEHRVRSHPPGTPGIFESIPTGHSTREFVYRDGRGLPVAIIGICNATVVEFAVLKGFRRQGIARRMLKHMWDSYGCRSISGPFWPDGTAFVRAMTDRKDL